MLVLKKTFSSYTSSRMPEGTVNMFIMRHLLQKCWCSRRLSQATPPVGCLKAQLTFFNSYHDFTTKCWCSGRLSQATPPVGCLKAHAGNIYILLFTGLINVRLNSTKCMVLKKTFPSYTSR